ncbi:MAG: hypothetical protein WBA74_01830 [Cyclobacteriaceae bacterium]
MENKIEQYFESKLVYHSLVIISLLLIVGPYIYKIMDIRWFVVLISAHTFILRPILDKYRMKALGIYEDVGYWKFFFISRFKNYSKLMFE